jgi:hypothetical protein
VSGFEPLGVLVALLDRNALKEINMSVYGIFVCKWVVAGKNGTGHRQIRRFTGEVITNPDEAMAIRASEDIRNNKESDVEFVDVEELTSYKTASEFNKAEEIRKDEKVLESLANTILSIDDLSTMLNGDKHKLSFIKQYRENAAAEKAQRAAEREAEKEAATA